MDFNGLRLEYDLKGSSNYVSLKDHMEAVMEDNGLKEFIYNDIPKLLASDAKDLVEWKKCVAKAIGFNHIKKLPAYEF